MTIAYDLAADLYHLHMAIGSGTAKTFLVSPQLTLDTMNGGEKPDRPHYQIGRLAHLMLLEPGKFAKLVTAEGPLNPKTNQVYGRDTKAFQAWQAEHPDLTVVEPWLFTMLDRMPPSVRGIFADSQAWAEASLFQTLAGVSVKARLDWLQRISTSAMITDLKTIDNIDDYEAAIRRFKYWFQAGWYRMVARAEFGHSCGWQFVFAEKKPPHRWRIVELDADYLSYADEKADEVLNGIALAQRTGDWSDKEEVAVMASRPAWSLPDDESDDE